jgi:O-antigen ligase
MIAILPIAIWGVNFHYDWNKIAKCFIISSIASIFIYGIYVYILDFTPYIKLYHELPEFVHSWTFFGDRISLFKHRFYYGTILNLAIVSLLQIRIQQISVHRHRKSATAIIFAGLLILALGVVWTGSRANMLTLLIVGTVAMIQPLRGQTRALVSAMVCVGGIVIASLLFTLHPRFEQLELEHITERATYQIHEIEPRINIWYSVLQTPQDYVWYGVGVGGNSEYLKPIYTSFQWTTFYDRQYNAHNQYLGVLINLGIFAAIFFLLIWLLYPLWYTGKTRKIATLIALILGLNMFTENMLERIDGVIITCCTLLLIALLSRAQRAK